MKLKTSGPGYVRGPSVRCFATIELILRNHLSQSVLAGLAVAVYSWTPTSDVNHFLEVQMIQKTTGPQYSGSRLAKHF